MASMFKKNVKLELLTNFNMLLMVEERIRGGMCHVVHRYVNANNKYMKNYDEKEESSYTQHLDENNLYGWAMLQKLPVGGFKWIKDVSKIDEDFIKNYDENGDIGYFLKVDVKYPNELCNLHDKKNYVVHIRSLKQALNHGLILKKVHRVIPFYQEAWLKPYIDMNTELRK